MQQVAHDVATKELAEHLGPIFDASPDGVYVWLDEEHWICNQRFASLFGYEGPDALNDTPLLLQRLVHEDDRQLFSWHYWNRVQARAFPVTFRFRGMRCKPAGRFRRPTSVRRARWRCQPDRRRHPP